MLRLAATMPRSRQPPLLRTSRPQRLRQQPTRVRSTETHTIDTPWIISRRRPLWRYKGQPRSQTRDRQRGNTEVLMTSRQRAQRGNISSRLSSSCSPLLSALLEALDQCFERSFWPCGCLGVFCRVYRPSLVCSACGCSPELGKTPNTIESHWSACCCRGVTQDTEGRRGPLFPLMFRCHWMPRLGRHPCRAPGDLLVPGERLDCVLERSRSCLG